MRWERTKVNSSDRDIFILSKGHAAAALYAALASVGLIDKACLEAYSQNGSKMQLHPKKGSFPGIEVSTGALGHGLALGTGSALAAHILGNDAHTVVLMGDGECNEGLVWENAAFAAKQKLTNLIVIVDRNKLQGCGSDEEILNYGDMAEKFRAFGFHSIDINGHDYGEIKNALNQGWENNYGKPVAIIAHTIKGKGVSYMEDRLEWHYKSPNDEQYAQAMKELS
jgi:transketolase